MLKCINCGKTFDEIINVNQCDCSIDDDLHTNLYSTSIKHFPTVETALELDKKLGVYLKREDKNPTGTFKDRKSLLLAKRYETKFALASSGNQAISCGKYLSKLDIYLYVPSDIDITKLITLRDLYDEIEFLDETWTAEKLTKGEADRWNITNGMDPIGASALYSLAMELEPHNFDNIVVSCGSGELYSALAVYFNVLRKKKVNIIPVMCNLPEADAIKTDFVACQPFLDRLCPEVEEVEDSDRLKYYAELYNCEISSATVFVADEELNLKGKTCLVVTGAKK
jgi:cysteine synthase